MSPVPALNEISDFQVAAVTALIVIANFLVATFAQRRRTAPHVSPTGATQAGLAGVDERIAGFEGRMTTRLERIEERQSSGEERLKGTEHDVRNIRTALQALPSKDAVHRLEVQLTELNGKVTTVDTVALATQRSVDRIVSHLLKETP